jgi:hypothetical protein
MLLLGTACALKPIAGPQYGLSSAHAEQRVVIARGDRLRILTTDGRRRMVTVSDASEQAIMTGHETIPVSDLVFVERREFSPGRAAAATGAVLIVIVIATGLPTIAFIPNTAPVTP